MLRGRSRAARRLSELFWPEAANPMNSLAQHLVHLRSLPGAMHEDGRRVEAGSDVGCDVDELRGLAQGGQLERAAALYGGPFLDTLSIPLGTDLEEWVYDTRETLGREVRGLWLNLAAQAAAHGRVNEAGEQAARALEVRGAPPPDDLELPRLHHLLHLAGHPLAEAVEREARALGLLLGVVPGLCGAPFVGRERKLDQLARLGAGEVAWVSGPAAWARAPCCWRWPAPGAGQVLSARANRPYGTLEPLTAGTPPGPAAPLVPLRDPALRLAIDDWEGADAATQAVLALAARRSNSARAFSRSASTTRRPSFSVWRAAVRELSFFCSPASSLVSSLRSSEMMAARSRASSRSVVSVPVCSSCVRWSRCRAPSSCSTFDSSIATSAASRPSLRRRLARERRVVPSDWMSKASLSSPMPGASTINPTALGSTESPTSMGPASLSA